MTGNPAVIAYENDEEQQSPSSHPQYTRLASTSSSGSRSFSTEDDTSAMSALLTTGDSKVATPRSPDSCVQVAVRVRPLLSSLESGCGSCMTILPARDYATAIQVGPSTGPTFTFDEVFPASTNQVEVFEHRVAPLVERCLEGYNATILAYGQTGSGKTHTVIGPSSCHSSPDEPSSGMIPRAVNALFQMLQLQLQPHIDNSQRQSTKPSISPSRSSSMKSPPTSPNSMQSTTTSPDEPKRIDACISYEFQVRVQFLELYGEEIRDLLASTNSPERLTIRDIGNDEPEVVGATSHVVKSAEEALRCLTKGMLRRVTAATAMNESSSRSHAIFSIVMEQTWTTTTTTTSISPTGPQVRRSKFNFVDLAGSERQKRTRAEGQRLKEGIEINKGLLTLGNVISALGDPKKRGKAFVPYRDSKLTRLLKGSLGGNHKTLMIACVSPSSTNMEESLNCLRYANRAKNIQNRAHVNVDARTRVITELKAQVASLAADLLRAMDTGDLTGGAFSRQDLIVIAQGGDGATRSVGTTASHGKNGASGNESPASLIPSIPSTSRLLTPEHTQVRGLQQQQRVQDLEEELNRTSNLVKRCRRENVALEERLHVTKAEKEFYRLQLEAVSKPVGAADSGPSSVVHVDQMFVNRASSYEKEIDRLKDELRVVRSQLVEQREPAEDEATFSIEKANQDMRADRERLAAIQNELLLQNGPPTTTHFKESRDGVDDSLDFADSEEKAEEEHLTELTLKYSHIDDEDEAMIVDHKNAPRVVEASNATQIESAGKVAEQRRAQIEADLLEISRIIESKEELISQLQCSQAKYSSMKDFYEGKLHAMERLLDQKEEERQKIILELERLKQSNHDTRDLEEQLKKKEEHIAGIRKQKLQLKDLTVVSSKNEAEIKKLQNDVHAMLERKVSMQKQLAVERKAHAQEIKRLKKEVMQKDRETRKWQKISDQKTSEAAKANHMAQMKAQQLGQLREKYKDAEKTIRMLQIKKGVMAKAGLDSVIVGRRGKDTSSTRDQGRNPANDGRVVDVDSLRDYFDTKVAEVGRKEALADKLARGWEEHFQLTLQRGELVGREAAESKDDIQALDLRIQYEEDRIRKLAHRLGKGAPPVPGNAAQHTDQNSSFLYGKDFAKLCNGTPPARASEIAAKVLFGMVVRERRRIASLAKTASALDEKLRECQLDNESKEVAFRSYVQDSQHDFANISMNHQEQILSLMSLVKNDDDTPDNSRRTDSTIAAPGRDSSASAPIESSKMLVLANERIGILEQQLRDRKAEIRVGESYRVEKEEIEASLATKNVECEKLEVRLAGLRSTLRQIREELMKARADGCGSSVQDKDDVNNLCLAIIREALLESPVRLSPMARRHSCPNIFQPATSPQTQRQWEFIRGADDDDEGDDEEEAPDWADEIMQDLAFIADGRLPPSMEGVQAMFEAAMHEEEKKSVFEEPPDLVRYKIDQRASTFSSTDDSACTAALGSASNHDHDKNLDKWLADTLMVDTLLMSEFTNPSPTGPETTTTTGDDGNAAANHVELSGGSSVEIRPSSSVKHAGTVKSLGWNDDSDGSVFARLVNPTNFTGTQKEKHCAYTETQKAHQNASAERLLDTLLENQRDIVGSPPSRRVSENSSKSNAIEAGSKVKEYTRVNVYERLQKTTTQSFAGKHAPAHDTPDTLHEGHAIAVQKAELAKPKLGSDNRAKRVTPQSTDHTNQSAESQPIPSKIKSPPRPKLKPSSRYNTPTRIRSPFRAKSPAKTRADDYTQQNVFERLTKTTTEAYAVKKRVVKN